MSTIVTLIVLLTTFVPLLLKVTIGKPFPNNTRLSFYGNGVSVAFARNVCVATGEKGPETIVYFPRLRDEERVVEKDWRSVGNISNGWKYYGFRWGWKFEDRIINTYADVIFSDEPNVWIGGLAFKKHVNHFADALMTLVHVFSNRERFPRLGRFVLPGYVPEKEYPYNNFMFNSIMEWGQVDTTHDFRPRCYERVVLVGRPIAGQAGSLFHERKEYNAFRTRILNAIGGARGPFEKARVPFKLNVFYSERTTRELTNKNKVLALIKEQFSSRVNMQTGDFGSMSPEQQVATAKDTDILIGSHGTNMHNLLFMAPHSAVLEVHQYHTISEHFSALSDVTEKFHQVVPAIKPPKFDQIRKRCSGRIMNYCRESVMFQPITVDIEMFELLLKKAMNHVAVNKYGTIATRIRS